MHIPPPSKRIVYTRHEDGGTSVLCPIGAAFYWMQRGGLWGDRPRGFFAEQLRRQVESGIPPDVAKRYLNALQYGGVTESEAWGIFKDRTHNPSGHSHELIDFADLPSRWFRNAWARGHNGGPPHVDLHKARPIQWRKIVDAKRLENQRREQDLDDVLGEMKLDEASLKTAIRHARDEDELQRVWPEGLPFPKLADLAASHRRQALTAHT